MIFGESIVLHELLNLLITGDKFLGENVFLLKYFERESNGYFTGLLTLQ